MADASPSQDPQGQLLPTPPPVAEPAPSQPTQDMSQLVQPVSPNEVAQGNAANVPPGAPPPPPQGPTVNMVPPGAAFPFNQQQGAPESSQGAAPSQAPAKDNGDGTATVTTPDGRSIRVAISGLSPAMRDSLMPTPVGTGMGEINALQKRSEKGEAAAFRAQATAAKDDREALNEKFKYDQQQNNDAYRLQAQNQQNQNRLMADGQQHQQDLQNVVQQRASDLQRIQGQMGQTTFDPDRYMKNRSGGQAAMSAIGIMLGGLGQAFVPGAQNTGIEALKRHVESDVQAQREAYNRMGDQANFANNAYSMARQAKMDDAQATLAARQVSLDQLRTGLDVVGAKYASASTDANRKAAIAHLDGEQAKVMADFNRASTTQGLQFANSRQQQRQFAWQQQMGMAQLGMEHERIAATLAAKQGKGGLTIPGLRGVAATPDTLTKAQAVENAYQTMTPMIDRLMHLRKEYGREVLPTAAQAEANDTASNLQLQAKQLFQLGVLSESDLNMLNKIIPAEPLSPWSSDNVVQEKLKAFRDNSAMSRRKMLHTFGFEPEEADKPQFDEQPVGGG